MFLIFLRNIAAMAFRPSFWMTMLAFAIWCGLMLTKVFVNFALGIQSYWEWPATFGVAFLVVWIINICRIWFGRWG